MTQYLPGQIAAGFCGDASLEDPGNPMTVATTNPASETHTAEASGPARAPDDALRWSVAGLDILLHTDPAVFRPTVTTGLLTGEVLRAGVSGRAVLDLGCGSGPIAIALAKAGAAPVCASDLMPEACELARRNAVANGVSAQIEVLRGDLFEAVGDRRFDIVVDDVSGVAEEVAILSSWFPPSVPLGGYDGTSLAVDMLRQSPRHLEPGGALWFPVLSLSNAARIVAVAGEVYGDGLELVAAKLIPFSPELKDNLATLTRLRDRGLISFEQVRSRLCWTLEIYRATARR